MTIEEINESLAKQQRIHKAALEIVRILDQVESDLDDEAREEVLRMASEDAE